MIELSKNLDGVPLNAGGRKMQAAFGQHHRARTRLRIGMCCPNARSRRRIIRTERFLCWACKRVYSKFVSRALMRMRTSPRWECRRLWLSSPAKSAGRHSVRTSVWPPCTAGAQVDGSGSPVSGRRSRRATLRCWMAAELARCQYWAVHGCGGWKTAARSRPRACAGAQRQL